MEIMDILREGIRDIDKQAAWRTQSIRVLIHQYFRKDSKNKLPIVNKALRLYREVNELDVVKNQLLEQLKKESQFYLHGT